MTAGSTYFHAKSGAHRTRLQFDPLSAGAICLSVVELIPESYVAPIDPAKVFGRTAPLQVDLGCGDGDLVVAMAGRHPEKNFLGIERMSGRVAKTSRKALKLPNVRVLHVETSYAIRYLLPENSVEIFYLLFPDPWPKRRHHERRVVSSEFLDSIVRALEPNGLFHVATDQKDYFEQIERIASDKTRLRTIECDIDLPVTTFQRRFQEQGMPIYRLSLRKNVPR